MITMNLLTGNLTRPSVTTASTTTQAPSLPCHVCQGREKSRSCPATAIPGSATVARLYMGLPGSLVSEADPASIVAKLAPE